MIDNMNLLWRSFWVLFSGGMIGFTIARGDFAITIVFMIFSVLSVSFLILDSIHKDRKKEET